MEVCMRCSGGYVRVEGGVWVNMLAVRLMRLYRSVDGIWMVEVQMDGETWLCEEGYGSEEEAVRGLDEFFEGLR